MLWLKADSPSVFVDDHSLLNLDCKTPTDPPGVIERLSSAKSIEGLFRLRWIWSTSRWVVNCSWLKGLFFLWTVVYKKMSKKKKNKQTLESPLPHFSHFEATGGHLDIWLRCLLNATLLEIIRTRLTRRRIVCRPRRHLRNYMHIVSGLGIILDYLDGPGGHNWGKGTP